MATETLLRLRDAAAILGVSPQTLRRWHKRGLVVWVRLPNGQFRALREELDKLLKGEG